jgi:hypothetical protein
LGSAHILACFLSLVLLHDAGLFAAHDETDM